MMRAACCFFSLSLCIAAGTTSLSCKSDSGENVDFSYSFKYPKGWEYAYMDGHSTLAKSSKELTSAESSVSATIMQMESSDVGYLMWNDEPPKHSSSSAPNAHSKGLLLFSSASGSGVWLTHSLPKFPDVAATSAEALYTEAADEFGQSYLCITISAATIHQIAPLMDITRPTIYASKFSSAQESSFSDLKALSNRGGWNDVDMTHTVDIKSKGGQKFTVFGKAGAWGVGKDLYHDLVAPALGELEMEGWRRGKGVWGPACGKDEVLDITEVSFPGEDWPTMNDHSKWAVDKAGTSFCVGDLNRADGQDKRGGATVCIGSSKFAGVMKKVIKTTDACSGEEKPVIV